MQVKSVMSSSDFAKEIESLAKEKKIDYMDAVIDYCGTHNLEIETIASLVKSNQTLKAKIQNEAEQLNFLPKTAKLPI